MRIVTLPNGRAVSLTAYRQAWQALKADPDREYRGFEWYALPGAEILRKLRAGIDARVNRHLPHFGQGRKWADDWQIDTSRMARELNTPRLAIHWLPLEWRQRFADRLTERD